MSEGRSNHIEMAQALIREADEMRQGEAQAVVAGRALVHAILAALDEWKGAQPTPGDTQ